MTSVAAGPDPAPLPGRSIAAAALAGGLVDLVYASAVGALDGRGVLKVWQGVASGWVGRAAGDHGWASAALGIATHFGIATAMAGTYAVAAARLPILRRRPLACGAVYGLGLYGVMYGLVLPLRWPGAFPKWEGARSAADMAAHVGVGLAIAWAVSRTAPKPNH